MAWQHLFIPHKDTHKKAHLISWHGLLIWVLVFILLQVSFSILGNIKPGVLGISSSIDQKSVIELTNKEREKLGLSDVVENSALDQAAQAKAQNMFAENYWSHFAPSGKSPWDFILGSGYKFTYAGENLAKNFYSSEDVVKAWMDSPTHRDNLLNPNYQDIGIAVVDGVLNGQKTTLVVQEFGTTSLIAHQPTVSVSGKDLPVSKDDYNSQPTLVASVQTNIDRQPLFDPYKVYKTFGVGLLALISGLLVIDFIILRRRGVFRQMSHHFANLSFLAAGLVGIFMSEPGNIL